MTLDESDKQLQSLVWVAMLMEILGDVSRSLVEGREQEHQKKLLTLAECSLEALRDRRNDNWVIEPEERLEQFAENAVDECVEYIKETVRDWDSGYLTDKEPLRRIIKKAFNLGEQDDAV